MVAISPCMKAQGTLEPTRGHRSPLGQYTSPPPPVVPVVPCCCLMLWREHGKQNLCDGADGHCTKCVSSSRSRHSVQQSAGAGAGVPGAPPPTPGTPGVGGAPGVSGGATATDESAGLLDRAEEGERGLPLFRRDPPPGPPGPTPIIMVVECTRLASLAGEPALSAARMSAAMGDWPPCWAVAPSGGVVREWCEGETTAAVEEDEEEVVVAGWGAAMGKPGFITSKGDGSQGSPAAPPFSLGAEASASGSGDVLRFRARDCCCFPLSAGRGKDRDKGQCNHNHSTGNSE